MGRITKGGQTDLVKLELGRIRDAHDGVLRPKDVVTFAKRNPRSALHKEFEWDDTKAAHAFRLEQARALIRVHVVVLPHNVAPIKVGVRVHEYVSLSDNRGDAGGYERTEDVLANPKRRRQMLLDTLQRLEDVHEAHLFPELATVVREIAKVRATLPASERKVA